MNLIAKDFQAVLSIPLITDVYKINNVYCVYEINNTDASTK
jgi:hypothetical protein